MDCILAIAGVFLGGLLWDTTVGDGFPEDDFLFAVIAALLAGCLQWWRSRSRPEIDE